MDLRARSEQALKELADDVEKYKGQNEDRKSSDQHEIAELHSVIKDLKYQNEQYYTQMKKH